MRHIEEDIQEMCVSWFNMQFPDLAMLLHHSPNGGRRTAREGARFKRMGTRAGFPDLVLFIPTNDFHALFIELKTARGRQTQTQKDWQQRVEGKGYCYRICRSFEEFMNIIKDYLKV